MMAEAVLNTIQTEMLTPGYIDRLLEKEHLAERSFLQLKVTSRGISVRTRWE